MGKFRKKPVVIDAVQLTETVVKAYLFDDVPLPDGLVFASSQCHPPSRSFDYFKCGIKTLEGFMEASVGDWIITGVKGERYPCRDDIFEATYEPVEGE